MPEDRTVLRRSSLKKKTDNDLYLEEVRQSLSIASSLGLSIILPMLAGLFIGRWIDTAAHTGAAFTLLLLFVGLFIGISTIIILLKK